MAKTNSTSFSNWLSHKNAVPNEAIDTIQDGSDEGFSLLGQFQLIQDGLSSQLQELSGSLPEAGPLSAAFRKRLKYAVYLLLGSFAFLILAILIGVPTIVLRPQKFVLCLTVSTLLAASSVIILQKPSIFVKNMFTGGFKASAPILLLLFASLSTIYVTIFLKKYVLIILCGGAQLASILWYLASFIPGGTRGLQLITKAAYVMLKTLLKPCLFATKKIFISLTSSLFR